MTPKPDRSATPPSPTATPPRALRTAPPAVDHRSPGFYQELVTLIFYAYDFF